LGIFLKIITSTKFSDEFSFTFSNNKYKNTKFTKQTNFNRKGNQRILPEFPKIQKNSVHRSFHLQNNKGLT